MRQLRRALAGQQDSVQRVRQRLAATQETLEYTAQMANYAESGAPGAIRARARQKTVPAGTLYGKLAIVTLDAELAEVLLSADTTASSEAVGCSVKAYRVCNGPADATQDACTCSHYVYLALTGGDAVEEYKLFRIGPFYQARFAGWTAVPDSPKPDDTGYQNQLILRIRHDIMGRQKTDAFRISWQGVRQL